MAEPNPLQRASSDSLTERLRDSLTIDHNNKSDSSKPPHSSATTSTSSSTESIARRRSDAQSTDILHPSSVDLIGSAKSRPGHRRSMSAGVPLFFSGRSFGNITRGSTAAANAHVSANLNLNVVAPKAAVLGSGTANYGHGSIMRGGGGLRVSGGEGNGNVGGGEMRIVEESVLKKGMGSCDPEEVKKGGNEMYRRGNYVDALALYDRAISMSPRVAAYRSNRAAALGEAVKECKEAVRLDSGFLRDHQRLASLYLRLGLVENARYHIGFPGQLPDPNELQKLYNVEKHLSRCEDARNIRDWKSALKESDAGIAAGADLSLQLIACRAEALLRLQRLDDAQYTVSDLQKYEAHSSLGSHIKFYGILSEAYVLYVKAQVDMAFGRFETAISFAEKAFRIDFISNEVKTFVEKVKMVASARSRGNDHFNSGKIAEACTAYGEGLKYDPTSSVLYCNRAICWSKMGLWEQSVEDCNQALRIQPTYTKALLRRTASYLKLERWVDAVKDFEILRKELPDDKEVADGLSNAQAASKKHPRDLATDNNEKFSDVQKVANIQQFKATTSPPSSSVFHLTKAPC